MQNALEFNTNVTLVSEECCVCGTPFAIESTLCASLKRTQDWFYCPNGHQQHYAKSTEEKLREAEKKLKSLDEQYQWWKNEAEQKSRQLSATKGQLTKTKKRLSGGVCPCCNRSFASLHRHMQMKHPEYTKEV